ncbi:unnamed protein product [Darwinula stevensoni]|uniref:Uncharacterized protein n=1 Tax=Darwinula stevensoni TaxID=69355 RepID=A0A7R9AD18_9CRUS|nr:unnamed protein product [Darwinula stevensoni]CAG0900336.1 unnamed protein product [Darwinula stevensoni]
MTRWARSLTSKASNKKTPEEATPWHVMVASMKATQSREQNPEADDFSHENETEEEKEEDEEVDPSYSEEVDESMKSSSIPCDSTAFKEEGDIEKEEEQDTEAGNHEMPEYEKASGSHKAQERKRKHQFVTEPMPGRAKIFFEGSWVTPEVKADLLKMRKKLLADGIPKDKVSELVRKGRRREEKSYKRDKKKGYAPMNLSLPKAFHCLIRALKDSGGSRLVLRRKSFLVGV